MPFRGQVILEKGVRVHTNCSIPFFIAHTKYLTSDSIEFIWAGPDTYSQAHLANPFAAVKTNTRLPGAAAHINRCFLRFVGADNIPHSQLRQGLMTVWRRRLNVRTTVLYRRESRDSYWVIGREDFVVSWTVWSSGLRPLKRFSLAHQPSIASSCQ